MATLKTAPEEVLLHDNNAIEFEPEFPSRRESAKKPPGGDVVVIPNFSRKKPFKKKTPPPKQQPPPPSQKPDEIGCLELPTKQTREIMRQVSGLGMEDPVFGSNHTFTRAVAKKHPYFNNLFADMSLSDFPDDMKDMLSVCSDPTSSLHNHDSFHRNNQRDGPQNNNYRAARMLSSSQAPGVDLEIDFSKRQLPLRRQTFAHAFVPPQSNKDLVREEMEEDLAAKGSNQNRDLQSGRGIFGQTDTDAPKKQSNPTSEKPSDRRWRSSTMERLYQHKEDTTWSRKQQVDNDLVQVIIPSFPSKKKSPRTDRFYQSEQTLNYHHQQQQHQSGPEPELQLEDLFTAGKAQERRVSKPSKLLSASDGNLFYNMELDMKRHSGGGGPMMKGLELNVQSDGLSRVSALTMEHSQFAETESTSERKGRRSSPKEPVIPEDIEEELMHQKSLSLCDLQKAEEEDENASVATHSSCSHGEKRDAPKKLSIPTKKEKSKKKSRDKESKDKKSRATKKESRETRGRSTNDKGQPQQGEDPPTASDSHRVGPMGVTAGLKKLYASSSDWAGPITEDLPQLVPLSPGKGKRTKSRRSHSLEGDRSRSKQASSAAAVHRKPSKKGGTPRKSGSHGTAERMLAIGNTSSSALARASDVRSKFARYKERAIEIAVRSSSSKKGRKSRTGSTKRSSDNLHASMSIMANDNVNDAEQLAAGAKSCGNLNFDMTSP